MSPGKKWARVALTSAIVALLTSAVWLLVLLGERDSRLPKLALTLPQERLRARAAGLSETFDDLPKRPPIAEGENAAPLYREAVVLLPALTIEDRQALQRTLAEKATLADAARLEVLRKAAAPALVLVQRGVQRPHCDFGWRGELGEEGWKQRREVLLALDNLAMLLQANRTLVSLNTVQRLTWHLTQEQGLLVWNIRSRHRSLVADTLLKRVNESPALLPKLDAAWQRWAIPPGALKRSWMLQCVKERGDAQRYRTKLYKPEKEPFLDYNPLWRELDRLDHGLGWKLYADASEVINLRYWRGVKQALAPLPDGDLRAQWQALKLLDSVEEKRAKEIPGYWYPQLYSRNYGFLLLQNCRWNLGRTELALREAQRATGKLPTHVASLPAETPTLDPYTGKPLIWNGKLLYSAGWDEKDDGGDEKKDMVRDLSKEAAPPIRRSRLGTTRRPGQSVERVE